MDTKVNGSEEANDPNEKNNFQGLRFIPQNLFCYKPLMLSNT